jgi:hypothetical protein
VQHYRFFRCQENKGPIKPQPMRLTNLLTTIVLLLGLLACKKDKESNPFKNETKLDCNNLRVRKVTYKNFLNINPNSSFGPYNIEVLIENTCKTCDDDGVYLGVFMIDKTTQDTVARTACSSCASGVKNKTRGNYLLETQLTDLPDLKNIRFDYSYLCQDVPYEPTER